MQRNQSKRLRRRGASLIDVATGSMLLAVLLIPSIHLIGESQSSHRRLDHRDIILYEAEQLVEATRVALAEPAAFSAAMGSSFNTVTTIPVSDAPDLTGRVRAAADTTIPSAQLLTIVVDVWNDQDGDSVFDADELGETIRTQWAAP